MSTAGPLHVACYANNVGMAEFLLREGGTKLLEYRDDEGQTPFDIMSANPEMAVSLQRFGHKKDPCATLKMRFLDLYLKENGSVTCPVCLEECTTNLIVLDCSHFLCKVDYARLQTESPARCPECRETISRAAHLIS